MDNWIECKKQLPEPGQPVFYFFKHVGAHAGHFDVEVLDPEIFDYDLEENGGPCLSNIFYGKSGFLSDDATHWMPRDENDFEVPDPPFYYVDLLIILTSEVNSTGVINKKDFDAYVKDPDVIYTSDVESLEGFSKIEGVGNFICLKESDWLDNYADLVYLRAQYGKIWVGRCGHVPSFLNSEITGDFLYKLKKFSEYFGFHGPLYYFQMLSALEVARTANSTLGVYLPKGIGKSGG